MTDTWAGAGTHRGRFSYVQAVRRKLAHYRCQSCGWTTSFCLKPIILGIIWLLEGLVENHYRAVRLPGVDIRDYVLMTGCTLAGVLCINIF
jgi:hypothetical protein